MRRLPFHILFLCIFMPPVLYILSLQAMEVLVQKKWTSELQGSLISDSELLLQGRIRIEDEIQRNVETFLASRKALKWGFRTQITIETEAGRRLYPSITPYGFDTEMFPQGKPVPAPTEMLSVAENNLKIMDEGLSLSLTVQIPRNALLANGVLVFYIVVFTFVLYRAYLSSTRAAKQIEIRNQQALEAANGKLNAAQQRLKDVKDRESSFQKEVETLKSDLDLASDKVKETEDEAIEEMERLEKRLHENVALKEEMELEVLRLGEELESIESAQKVPPKKQRKKIDSASKRFNTLYKNLDIQQRAIEGFLNLEMDMQLRAEELIHSMNEDVSKLSVKRKVFSKKGASPAFEFEFGYRGRIYWRPGSSTKAEVLVIGTKNTQTKDLAYLENQ